MRADISKKQDVANGFSFCTHGLDPMDEVSKPHYEFGGFRLDISLETLFSPSGDAIPLPSRAFATLRYLVEHSGQTVEKDVLMAEVWPKTIVAENNLNQCILRLRKVLGESAGERRFILTLPGRGFRFVAPVRVVPYGHADSREPATSPPIKIAGGGWRLWTVLGGAGLLAALLLITVIQSMRHRGVTSPAEYQPLTDLADYATSPVLSRDGRMLAFIRNGAWLLGHGQIWLKMLPDGEPVQLTNVSGPLFAPTFTPDGARVAFTLIDQHGESWDTWTVPITGGEPSKLLPNASGLNYIGSHEVMFSAFKSGIHLGIVTSTDNRSAYREIYWPVHERAMAHFSALSPDRKSVLVVEMDGTGSFQRCRLVPFDGSSSGAPIGPAGSCTSAVWSADGAWAYLAVNIGGHSHLWRLRMPSGEAQQITFGPTDEETVFAAADGRSLLASVGTRQHTLWLHDAQGERLLTSESNAFAPLLSADARRVYFLSNRNSSADTALFRLDIATGTREMLLPGFDVAEYDVSPDEQQVVFTKVDGDAYQLWLAPLDRREPPKLLIEGGDSPRFGGEKVFFRRLGKQVNRLHSVKLDGSNEVEVVPSPIVNFDAVSPDGKFVVVDKPVEGGLAAAWLLPVNGGSGQQIGRGWWPSRWSRDGTLLYVEVGSANNETTIGRTVAVHVNPDGTLHEPILPISREAQVILHAQEDLSMGQDPSVYVYVKTDPRRNIYRIPLH